MITENVSTLKIHKLTQEQYDTALASGSLDENALYLTPNNITTDDSTSSSSTDTILYQNATGELEDLIIKTGSFINAGSGWNTFAFPQPFDNIPHVIATVESGYAIEIKNVSADKFLYRVTTGVVATTTTVSDTTVVTSIGLDATADEVEVRYTAIEYGGEE